MQFTVNSLARLLKNVEREVLVAAIKEADLQVLFRTDEVLEAIRLAHSPNPAVRSAIAYLKREYRKTVRTIVGRSILDPRVVWDYIDLYAMAITHDFLITWADDVNTWRDYLTLKSPGDPAPPPTVPEPALPADEILNDLRAAGNELIGVRDYLYASNLLIAHIFQRQRDRTEVYYKLTGAMDNAGRARARGSNKIADAIILIRRFQNG